MASNLLKAGHDVLAYDVAPEPLARFTAGGAGPRAIGTDRRRVPERDGDGVQHHRPVRAHAHRRARSRPRGRGDRLPGQWRGERSRGGDAATVEAERPFLEAVGGNVVHLGPLGAGLVGKLANNLEE